MVVQHRIFPLSGVEDNRKIAWINWESICASKEDGRLGVRRAGAFNLSLLDKWCWRMLVDKEGLWYRVLKARYGEEGAVERGWLAMFGLVEVSE
jgi:hypothetical protein